MKSKVEYKVIGHSGKEVKHPKSPKEARDNIDRILRKQVQKQMGK